MRYSVQWLSWILYFIRSDKWLFGKGLVHGTRASLSLSLLPSFLCSERTNGPRVLERVAVAMPIVGERERGMRRERLCSEGGFVVCAVAELSLNLFFFFYLVNLRRWRFAAALLTFLGFLGFNVLELWYRERTVFRLLVEDKGCIIV